MKLDFISVIVLIFCLGVCISLALEVKNAFTRMNPETIVAESGK